MRNVSSVKWICLPFHSFRVKFGLCKENLKCHYWGKSNKAKSDELKLA